MKIIVLMLTTLFLSACASSGLSLINGLAKIGQYTVKKDISFGPHVSNKMDLYLPESKRITATVVFFYGGCWGQCSKLNKSHYLFVAETLTKQGYAVAIPDYRQFPEVNFDEIIKDAKNAVNWTVQNSHDYSESNSIFLMGHSAGAHIAAMLIANKSHLGESVTAIDGFIGLAGPYNFLPFSDNYMFELFSDENDYKNSQPINFIDGSEPPFLLIHGKNDKKVNPKNASSLAAKLAKFNVDHKLVMLDKKSHVAVLINLAKLFRKNSDILFEVVQFVNLHKSN